MKKFFIIGLLCFNTNITKAQFLMDMLDTTKESGKGLLNIYKNFDHLQIGAYMQPQFQVIQERGAKTFEGTDFAPNVSNRFMLRRSRVRINYLHLNSKNDPGVQITFQFDANERGFTIRDIWGRVFENKYKLFSFTIGMFARPFGFETNLSSSDRESPERGRMNQTLMKSERDLGAMVSFDARKDIGWLKKIKIDAGFFNGQGIVANGDFDNKKDFIGRLSVKPLQLNKKLTLTGGVSLLHGGLLQATKYVYSTGELNGRKVVLLDSAGSNEGQYSPRVYKGADVQLKIKNHVGFTELRGEYITGMQTGTVNSSETPVALLAGNSGFYKRNFNGAYFYFLQHLFSLRHQLVVKYDWYDPNTKVKGKQIGESGTNFSAADIRYDALHIGYNYMIAPNVKLSLFYAVVTNEATQLPGFTGDAKDNIFTSRLQFRF
ncbi:MAG: porin [Bacteroidota bacterium]